MLQQELALISHAQHSDGIRHLTEPWHDGLQDAVVLDDAAIIDIQYVFQFSDITCQCSPDGIDGCR